MLKTIWNLGKDDREFLWHKALTILYLDEIQLYELLDNDCRFIVECNEHPITEEIRRNPVG